MCSSDLAVGIIEVMVMVGVGVEHAVFVMDGDAPKQTGLGELVQRIVDGAAGHVRSGLPDFAGKPVGGHMPVTTVKKKPGDDPYEEYITARVKQAQLIWTYKEHQKKMAEIKELIIKTL